MEAACPEVPQVTPPGQTPCRAGGEWAPDDLLGLPTAAPSTLIHGAQPVPLYGWRDSMVWTGLSLRLHSCAQFLVLKAAMNIHVKEKKKPFQT